MLTDFSGFSQQQSLGKKIGLSFRLQRLLLTLRENICSQSTIKAIYLCSGYVQN